jgi:hypothetical protein
MVLKWGDHVSPPPGPLKMLTHAKLQIEKMTQYWFSMLDHLGHLSNIGPTQFSLKC